MTILEDAKSLAERVTFYRRPDRAALPGLTNARKPRAYRFRDDGETPNNPRLKLLHYRSAVKLPDAFDPAAVFEALFASNGWTDSWRDGIYPFLHFHTQTHEVLGIARGTVSARFGGARGRVLHLKPGDVVVLPAGTAIATSAPAATCLSPAPIRKADAMTSPSPATSITTKRSRASPRSSSPRQIRFTAGLVR